MLGIAVAGATIGLKVGNAYQKQALTALQQATEERTLLSDLQVRILYNRPAKQLAPYLNYPERFHVEIEASIERLARIQSLLEKRNTSAQKDASIQDKNETQQELNRLLVEFETTVEQFRHRTEVFDGVMGDLTQMSDTEAKQELLLFVQSSEFTRFIEFSDQLVVFSEHLKQQEHLAAAALQRAEGLRTRIIIAGLTLSVAIAALVAFYTSKIIVQPIEAVIDTAQRVTKENDFELQVPTTDAGDMGRLATSLNQLIKQVRLLLQQLEKKNTDLNKALKQLNQQQMRLVQSEKMSSLGQLVAGVAHEINNPVNFIQGNLPYLKEYTENLLTLLANFQTQYPNPGISLQQQIDDMDLAFIQADLPKTLDSMAIGTQRIHQIVLSLLNFSRKDAKDVKRVDVHEGMDSTLMILKQYLHDIDVVKHYDDLPTIECYPGQLNQVFMNILINAIDALNSPDWEANGTPRQIRIRTSLHLDGQSVIVAIADTGPGIPQHIQHRIFDPFFTTKTVGKGTGLGMSISYQIITEKHGGVLTCLSEPGQGAEFIIQIPMTQVATKMSELMAA